MKKIVCILLLVAVCLTFVGCANDTTIRVVEVEKIVEVPVEVEVEKIVEVPVKTIKEVEVLVPVQALPPKFSCFSDYDWETLEAGDFIENVLCVSGAVVVDYEVTYSWSGGSYNIPTISYVYKYNATSTSNVRIAGPNNSYISGVATGTIRKINQQYNEFGYLDEIVIYLQ